MFSIQLAKDSLRTLWTHKYLWVFGLFAAAGAGGGGGAPSQATGSHTADLPPWLLPVIVGAVVLSALIGVAHVVSESALIDSVHRDHDHASHSPSSALRAGLHHFWRMLGLKLLLGLVYLVTALLLVVAPALAAFKLIPLWAGITITLPLAVVAVPWFLTLYFVYLFAMRFVVVEERSVTGAIRGAHRFLHGRLVKSIELLIVETLGRMACTAIGAVAVLVIGGLLGGTLYLTLGLVPAVVGLGIVAVPAALLTGGVNGTFSSSLWTLGFLEERSC